MILSLPVNHKINISLVTDETRRDRRLLPYDASHAIQLDRQIMNTEAFVPPLDAAIR